MKSKFISLFYLFFPLIGGAVVGFIMKDGIDYNSLIQPPLSPPSIVFPIVWSILYLLIGIAYFIYRKRNSDSKTIILYYLQLFFNYLWSILFFVLKWRLISVFWIVILLCLIILVMFYFSKQEKISFWLFLPYVIWVLFATYLNIGVYILN